MKGIFSWFKNSTKMKRWICMVLLGIVCMCCAISAILSYPTLSIQETCGIVVLFVLGFTVTIIGIVFAQKRTLELLIEASDLRLEQGKRNVNMNSLIFNKKIYDKGPNIVVIGGGSGLNTVLKGLKNYTSNITAIVTVSDYGKKPTDSRKELELLPLDDIKDSLIALSYNEKEMSNLLNYKFQYRGLKNLSFGDVYLYAMKEAYGDFTESIEKSKDILNIIGRVLPVTLDEITICAELENGMVVEEKDKIPEVVFDKVTKINRIYINPSNCVPAPGVLEAIRRADAIIIGPGSLYTNVIPNLLVKNVSKTIKESKAIKIYVNNIMTEPGQTDNFSISDHIKAIIDHVGTGIMDYCIYDTGEIIPEFVRKYNRGGQDLVEQDIAKAKDLGVKLLQRDLSTIIDDNIRHNPKAVAEAIIQIICDDLKYRDMQSDPQYVMLNSRLKEEKKFKKKAKATKKVNAKAQRKTNKPAKHEKKKRTSKFTSKYKDRIESIQTSDEKRIENQKRIEQQK
jgi:uncharacterized cofD-like protein